MKNFISIFFIIFVLTFMVSCKNNSPSSANINKIDIPAKTPTEKSTTPTNTKSQYNDKDYLNEILNKYKNTKPKKWGENIEGTISKINTEKKLIALTFDACGGPEGNDYDEELINYLIEYDIEATLFLNYRWIDANIELAKELSNNELFEIENHGYNHKPLSVNGKSIYNIKGTSNLSELIDEIILNAQKIEELTGRKTKYFRPGTAYCDEIAIEIAKDYNHKILGYNVLGDAGATYSKEKVSSSLLKSKSGSIVLLHMNHPQSETFEGVKFAIPKLLDKGFKFVKLENCELE